MPHDLSMSPPTSTGCGGGHCTCGGASPARAAAPTPALSPARTPMPTLALAPVARINGVALHEAEEALDAATLRERAFAELLVQEAVKQGLLPSGRGAVAQAPNEAEQRVIETLLDQAVTSPEPTEDECHRHYQAQRSRLVVGQAVHLRHILFAVTPGVNVNALSQRAEAALLSLSRQDAPAGRFEQLAAELSNCPSGAQGGDLGWVTPHTCAPELAEHLFFQADAGGITEASAAADPGAPVAHSPVGHGSVAAGVHPRLVHSRFGLHIVEVLDRRPGHLPEFAQVRSQIASRLALQSRSTALRQYMQLLVGQAKVEGLTLEGADSPLVQ